MKNPEINNQTPEKNSFEANLDRLRSEKQERDEKYAKFVEQQNFREDISKLRGNLNHYDEKIFNDPVLKEEAIQFVSGDLSLLMEDSMYKGKDFVYETSNLRWKGHYCYSNVTAWIDVSIEKNKLPKNIYERNFCLHHITACIWLRKIGVN